MLLQFLNVLSPPPPPTQTTFPDLSRRAITFAIPILPALVNPLSAQAAEPNTAVQQQDQQIAPNSNNACTSQFPITQKAFFDVSIGGEPAGRVTVGLYGDTVPLGTSRFLSLASGKAGIGYRRKEFIKILPNYVQHGGVISYAANPEVNDRLTEELASLYGKCGPDRTMNVAGSVGIVIRDPSLPPPKPKLVARKGKLEIEEEQEGIVPNATEFVIATGDALELDRSALVVGRVVGGMDVVDKIAKVQSVKENTGSAYFRVAKLIGDKRAVVAERGFNRPYTKIVITNCGLMD